MKIIKQIGIIFFICWVAQIIEGVLPFDFPASVIGMLLVFLLLLLRVLKVEYIKEKADFLLGNMAFFFLPAGVSIINYFDVLKSCAVQLVVICVVSTVLTFAATAFGMKAVMRLMGRRGGTACQAVSSGDSGCAGPAGQCRSDESGRKGGRV